LRGSPDSPTLVAAIEALRAGLIGKVFRKEESIKRE
jgi:hypothetical protein